MVKILDEARNDLLHKIDEGQLSFLQGLAPSEFKILHESIRNFVRDNEAKLEKWTIQLVEKKITEEEYEFLIKGMKNLVTLSGLTAKGITAVKIENIKSDLLVYFVRSVFSFIKKVM